MATFRIHSLVEYGRQLLRQRGILEVFERSRKGKGPIGIFALGGWHVRTLVHRAGSFQVRHYYRGRAVCQSCERLGNRVSEFPFRVHATRLDEFLSELLLRILIGFDAELLLRFEIGSGPHAG